MILVTGATGNVGGEVVAALVEAGEPVRALRRGTSAVPGADLVTGDLDQPESLAAARYMALSVQAVRESGVPWTFLRPSAFMSNTLR